MKPSRTGLAIWVALALCWPVPLFGLEGSYVPLARFVQLASAITALGLVEGTEGMVGLFMGLLWGHVALWAFVHCAVAWAVSRFAIARAPEAARAGCALVAVAVVVVWGVFVAEYDTQFHHSDPHASFWSLYR